MSFEQLDRESYENSTAADLGRRVAKGELSPVQLAELAVDIAASEEPRLNAYAALMSDRVLSEATKREAEARDGRIRGPLHGVPIASKDNLYIAGEPAGKGSLTTPETPASQSSPMVERVLDAGALIIGRTTTPEFGWKGTGISPRTGITRNPWDPTRNSGGSSAGSGATVGSGAVPFATGTDAGGSVRIPAAFCGVVGFKPTLSAIPVWPGTVNESLSHAGTITRSVGDARLAFDLTRGPDPRDPQSFFASGGPRFPLRSRPRVAVLADPFGIAPTEEVAVLFEDAVSRLRAADIADLVDARLPTALPRDIFEGLWVTGRGFGFAELIREHREIMDPGLARLADLAEGYSLAGFLDILQLRRAFNAAMFGLFPEWDFLLMPTMPLTAFGAGDEVPPGGEADAPLPWITWTPYTYAFNITGQPAITVPTHLRAGSLPVGIQIVGPWAADHAVLNFAERCESVVAPTIERRTARSV